MAAFSSLSDAWMMFSCELMPKSPRIVPGAALRELVAPVSARTTATTSLPLRHMTMTGVAIIERSSEGKKGLSTRCA